MTTPLSAWRRPHAWPLRLRLVLVLAPLIVAVGLLVLHASAARDAQLRHDALLTARYMMAGIDRELASIQTSLQVLAASDSLARDDLERFQRTAEVTVKTLIANNIVLSDAEGRQLVNTFKPWGTALPARGNPTEIQTVFATHKPAVSDLFTGPVTGTRLVAAGVPVFRGDAVIYSLGVGLSPDRVGQVLNRLELPEGWIAAVLDGSGTIIARTREAARFVGQPAVPELAARVAAQTEGTLDTSTKDGTSVIAAFSRSRQSRWSLAVGVPTASRDATWLRLVAVAAVATLLSVALALRLLPRTAQ